MPEPQLHDGNGGYWAKNQLWGISFVLFRAGAGKVPVCKHRLTPVPCFRTLNKHHQLGSQGLLLFKWIVIEGMFFSSVAREVSLFRVCLNSMEPYVRLLIHFRERCPALGVVLPPSPICWELGLQCVSVQRWNCYQMGSSGKILGEWRSALDRGYCAAVSF